MQLMWGGQKSNLWWWVCQTDLMYIRTADHDDMINWKFFTIQIIGVNTTKKIKIWIKGEKNLNELHDYLCLIWETWCKVSQEALLQKAGMLNPLYHSISLVFPFFIFQKLISLCIWSRRFCLWKPRQWDIRYKHTPYSQGLEREPSLTPIDQLFYIITGKKQPWLWQLSVHYTGLDQIRFICRYKQKQFLFYMIYHPILNLNHENKLLHQSKATKVGRLL